MTTSIASPARDAVKSLCKRHLMEFGRGVIRTLAIPPLTVKPSPSCLRLRQHQQPVKSLVVRGDRVGKGRRETGGHYRTAGVDPISLAQVGSVLHLIREPEYCVPTELEGVVGDD